MSNHAHRRPAAGVEPAPRRSGLLARLFGSGSSSPHATVVVRTASSRVEAELMAGYLRSNGIRAVVSGDDEGGLSPALASAFRVRVLVPQAHHARASKLLESR